MTTAMLIRALLIGTAISGLVAGAAAAQATVNPGRVDQRFRQPAPQPQVSPTAPAPLLPNPDAAKAAETKFTVRSIVFDGAEGVPGDVLQALAAPYVDHEISLADAQGLARRVTAEYRNRGLILSRAIVPPQALDAGVLHIQVIEGYFSEVKIEGNAGGHRRTLEVYAKRITAMRPVTAAALERLLLLANDLPGLQVRSVVTPSPSTPAAAILTLVVERKPVDASISLDNRGSRWLGPVEGFASIGINDLAGTGSRLGISGALSQQTELAYGAVSYDQPIGVDGLMLNLSASHARTRPGDELKLIDTKGSADTFSADLSYPLVRRRNQNLYLQVGFTARNSNSSNIAASPLFDDKVRFLSAGLSGNVADALRGVTSVRVSVSHSLNVFDATRSGDPNKSRATASGDFTYANAEIVRTQPLAAGFSLRLAAAGQASSDSLLSSEEFGLGGLFYGRAFDQSEITGDKGLAGSAELRWSPAKALLFRGVEFYGYFEGGRVWQVDPLPAEARHQSLESAGFGARVNFTDRIRGSLEFAKPIGRDVASEGDRDGRVFFSLAANY